MKTAAEVTNETLGTKTLGIKDQRHRVCGQIRCVVEEKSNFTPKVLTRVTRKISRTSQPRDCFLLRLRKLGGELVWQEDKDIF